VSATPPLVSIVGKKKSGKTTLVEALVAELVRRGLRVGTIKHGHHFDLDTPGTDSWRHRAAGSARTVLAGPDGFAVVGGWPEGRPAGPLELAVRHLGDVDVVVVEGFKAEPVPKIEIFRRAAHPDPVFPPGSEGADRVIAVVTDDPSYGASLDCPWLHAEAPDLAARLVDLIRARLPASRSGPADPRLPG
jgi:molybdopterin-guanine dinucleotide biosynthesis protein MobB